MNKEKLEYVAGISRFHEMMWIDRENGKIKQLYDWEYNPIDTDLLYKSQISVVVKGGFTYKDEFIALDNVEEISKKRALGHQRKRKGHTIDQMM